MSDLIHIKSDNVKSPSTSTVIPVEEVSCVGESIIGTFTVGREAPPTAKFRGTSVAATGTDCDIHPAVSRARTALLPYLDDQRQVVSRARGRAARISFKCATDATAACPSYKCSVPPDAW
jgi:hypothetical protein